MQFLNDILTNLFDRKAGRAKDKVDVSDLTTEALLSAVMSTEGDVSAHIYASQLLMRFNAMDYDKQVEFFKLVLSLDLDPDALIKAAQAYQNSGDATDLGAISKHADPKWNELFRRLNAVPNGTVILVRMRTILLKAMKQEPSLQRLDVGLKSLMLSWFNSGFLVLKPIDWSTSANILEKIIAYEAVHEIASWEDLRARLAPQDRRCFAFFHPAMPDEPLIFVEVALMTDTPAAIADVLKTPRQMVQEDDATVAVFYSISNCQSGLAGISFGNFLIKQVARDLQQDLPNLNRFVTLSPVPTFKPWLNTHKPDVFAEMNAHFARSADDGASNNELLNQKLTTAAAEYFLTSQRKDGKPNDPVARFHLGNGASLNRLNVFGDMSPKGIEQSFGLMVNYLYELDAVEKNHEDYSQNSAVNAADDITSLLK